ncbi:MAG: hypothetical protein PVF56_25070, partial [Desulfobacterales bacterium]
MFNIEFKKTLIDDFLRDAAWAIVLKDFDLLSNIWHERPLNEPGLGLGILIQANDTAVLEFKNRLFY